MDLFVMPFILFKTSAAQSIRSLLFLTALLGYEIVQDTHGCKNESSLYFIDEHNIKCIDLKKSNHSYVDMQTIKSGLVQAGAIDIDYRERMIYWSDNAMWTINRMNIDTLKTEVTIREDLGLVNGLAVEWTSGLIYWTDYLYERIEVAKLNGSSRKTLISSNLYNPSGIAVDPNTGFMFWADCGANGKIERAELTGVNRRILWSLYYSACPISLAVESQTERLYLERRYAFYEIGFNGNYRRFLRYTRENIKAVDMALYEDNLYWVDGNSRSIHWLNKTQPTDILSFGHLTNGILKGAVVSDVSRQPVTSPANRSSCSINNGGCSHLCLLAPYGRFQCACPNGVALNADRKTCSNVTRTRPPPPPVPDVKVRLRGSNSSLEGRVEVYHQGQWGTICDDEWGFEEATVLCKMLNYSAAIKTVKYVYRYYGRVPSSFIIWMDNVKCRGDEQSIAACRHNGWNVHDCSHYEDVGIICRNDSIPPNQGPTLAPGPHPELKVRLQSGVTINQGRVELLLNGTWGTICDDYWGIQEANVICRMLGYADGAWSTQCCGWYYRYPRPNKIWLDDVHCVGDERSIAECRHGGWGSHNCDYSEDVGVVCKYTPKIPDQKVRLADGFRDGEGRVEIFRGGHWGTLCDYYWDVMDAEVVCRQLGYSKAIGAPKGAFFGQGNGLTWLANCLGNESSIEDCRYWKNYGWYRCYHYSDASVICSNISVTLDSENFLLTCEGGRKFCYVIQFHPRNFSQPKMIPLKFEVSSRCSLWQTAMSYDPIENTIYWSEGCSSIYRGLLNDSAHQAVITNVNRVTDIEIDIAGRNIYFTDQDSNTIRVATLDGSYQAVVVEVQTPQGIALDSISGFIYFSSNGNSPRISRVDMDGSNEITLANLTNIGWTIVDVILDKPGNRLFFSDQSNNVIRYIDLGSLEILTLLSGNLHRPTSLTILNSTLYWTGWGNGKLTGAIFKAEINNASTAEMIADGFSYPKGIYFHSHIRPQMPVQSRCEDKGGCSQICVLIPSGRRCMCQPGMSIAEDQKTCVVGDAIFVADAYKKAIYMSSLSFPNAAIVALSLRNVSRPYGIDFNPLDSRIYWTDRATGVVARSSIDGNREDIQSKVVDPRGIALDLVGENVYWISSSGNTIEVSKFNGDFRKVLVANLISWARDIVLDTGRGYMYWLDGFNIQRAELDGDNRERIASLGTYYRYGGSGLSLDVDMNRIYFTTHNWYRKTVSYINLNSSKRSVETLVSSRFSWWYYGYYTGVAVDDRHVYFGLVLGGEGKVYRRNKRQRNGSLELVLSGFRSPTGIVIHKGNATEKPNHPCVKNNGGCTHLCLVKPSGYQCACPTIMTDERPCSTVPAVPTPSATPSAAPSAAPSDHCKRFTPCKSGASCEMIGRYYKCFCVGYYGGKNCTVNLKNEVVKVYFKGVTTEKFNKTAFINAIVEAFNDFCGEFPSRCLISLGSANTLTKREVNEVLLRPEDIYIPSDLKEVDGMVVIECAGVMTSGNPVLVSRNLLASVIKQKAAEIGQKLGGTIVAARTNPSPIKVTPTSETPTEIQRKGLIAGVTVAGGVIIIIAAIGIWYFRIKAKRAACLLYNTTNDVDKSSPTSHFTAFDNPGYNNAGIVDGDNESPVICSRYQERAETDAVNNPLYSELRMTTLSKAHDAVNKEGTSGVSDATKVTSEGNLSQGKGGLGGIY